MYIWSGLPFFPRCVRPGSGSFSPVCPRSHTTARNSPAADTIAVDYEREKRRATEEKTRRDAGLNSKKQLSRTQRQREIKGAPLSFLALNPYLSAVGFDDHLADHEAETGPFLVGHSRVATLAILGKEMTQLVRRYPVTAISHPHVRLGCIHTRPSDLHLASFRRELEGVADQIGEDLVEPSRIDVDRR